MPNLLICTLFIFFFSSRRRHTRSTRDWSSDVCSSDLDLHKAETNGVLPRFTIMSLGENHTRGTTPGAFTPEASVASNDIGLGKIVEAATRSRFWKETAIFVIEDDAQNGHDHVDAHRTS